MAEFSAVPAEAAQRFSLDVGRRPVWLMEGNGMSMKVKHWQDPANLVLGLWMVVSPWALAYQAETNAVWSAVIAGALVAALALFELFQVKAWEEWGNMALGIWMVIAPWVLGFATSAGAMWNTVIVGLAVAALALWALATDKDIGGWWSHAA